MSSGSDAAVLECGVVAQLVEHHNGIVGVRSSILLGSTILVQRFSFFSRFGGGVRCKKSRCAFWRVNSIAWGGS